MSVFNHKSFRIVVTAAILGAAGLLAAGSSAASAPTWESRAALSGLGKNAVSVLAMAPAMDDTQVLEVASATFTAGGKFKGSTPVTPGQQCYTAVLVTFPGLEFISADCKNPCDASCTLCVYKNLETGATSYSCLCATTPCP